MKISCSIMAHPSRKAYVDELVETLGLDGEHVTWDRSNDLWDTGMRSWLNHDADADWHLVIQDDAVVCADLLAGLERAFQAIPDESVASLYIGNTRPMRERMLRVTDDATKQGASWIRMPNLIWGVAMAAPVCTIRDMLWWSDHNYNPSYDTRIARYYHEALRWPAFYTWPSLADHRGDVPSLVGHAGTRHAHRFIGSEMSALDLDWSGAVIDVRAHRNWQRKR